ncbi:MAG: amino acid ABC transporter permease, partial [Trichococcus flocculiformis]
MSGIQWQYIFNPELALDSLPYVLKGMGYTLGIALTSMLNGTLLGFVLAMLQLAKLKPLRWLARLYISFMRGTPTLVILFLLYFGFPFIGIQFTAVTAAIIGFSMSSAAYSAEIIRSSLNSVNHGQWEAAYALGLKWSFIMRKVIVPQAMRIAIPPMSNVLLDLIKGSSLAAMITVPEMFQNAKIVGGREFDYMTMYILVALIYWA